jgi:hypothetical protein
MDEIVLGFRGGAADLVPNVLKSTPAERRCQGYSFPKFPIISLDNLIMGRDNGLRRRKNPKNSTEPSMVMGIDIPVLPKLFDQIDREARRNGLTARRWIGVHLAHYFNVPIEEAVPPIRSGGRPRKRPSSSATPTPDLMANPQE